VDLVLYMDHVEDIRLLHHGADSGFSSVVFDPSMLDYAANIGATDEAARWGHQRGLLLEADAFRLPSWACEFDSRHPLQVYFNIIAG
jgi:fructose/tagatose bisphosphate aldolase